MSLPHVLLGLLSEEPRTGYELARAMREDLDAIWRAEFSQIYPALARLRRAGFVHLEGARPPAGPPPEPLPRHRRREEGAAPVAGHPPFAVRQGRGARARRLLRRPVAGGAARRLPRPGEGPRV